MPYSTSNPPSLQNQGINNARGLKRWTLSGTDPDTTVDNSGYITNARALGMKPGDLVEYFKTDSNPAAVFTFIVTVINANGSADLSNSTPFTSVNSD